MTADRRADSRDAYSPSRRTALVLAGTGTAGAYHAGVLRALHEAGVKVDLMACSGIGVVGGLFAAIDAAPRLWDERGLWRSSRIAGYRWRPALIVAASAIGASLAMLIVPLACLAAGLIVYTLGFLFRITGLDAGGALATGYVRLIERAFEPAALPTLLPRMVVLAFLVLIGAFVAAGLGARARMRGRRSERGLFWQAVLGAPWTSSPILNRCRTGLWQVIRGATPLREPAAADLSRRYAELLAENLGQPGFRELLLVTHDLDARRDLVFALLAEPFRAAFFRREGVSGDRRGEAFDLAGAGREHVADALAAALGVPVACDPHLATFAREGFWRGETHRLCDRPGATARLLDEAAAAGAEQVIVVSTCAELTAPHGLAASRGGLRARLGEYLAAAEAAALRDAAGDASRASRLLFVIRPAHGAVGPFGFNGSYDDRSDRHQRLAELLDRGYEDAYRQFIEPIVGASGDRLEQVQVRPATR